MQYDLHSEYPIILRQTEEGVVGTWYENRFKEQIDILDELEALGKREEVDKIREYASTLGGKAMKFEHKIEVQRRIQHLAGTTKGYNPFHVIELIGQAYFEPLTSQRWSASGVTFIEWEEAGEEDAKYDKRYQVELEGALLKSMAQWDYEKGQWQDLGLVQLSYGTEMYEHFKGCDCTATPCK